MAAVVGLLGGVGLVGVVTAGPAAAATATFGYTGAEQTFTVPAGVTSIHVKAIGARGGVGAGGAPAGRGRVVAADLSVDPGRTLYVQVGGTPTGGSGCRLGAVCIGGFNGGGSAQYGGGGGGATDVRTTTRADESMTLNSRLLVAAGGGGSGESGHGCYSDGEGGGAGGDAGADGRPGGACPGPGGTGGRAGTLTQGGAGGTLEGTNGDLGLGGSTTFYGSGGGGGLYGGGGGGSSVFYSDTSTRAGAGGGGGGSSLVPEGGSSYVDTVATPGVVITYTPSDTTPPSVSCSAAPTQVKAIKSNNHKLVTVNTTVTVTDGGSGPAGFTLLGVSSSQPDGGLAADDVPNDIQGWDLGTADTSGLLRVERYATTRVYTFRYQGADNAGNTTTCTATVTVLKG